MKISLFIKLLLLILLFCLAVCIGIYNDSYVTFRMPFNQVYVKSLSFFMIGSFLVGVLITWLYLMISVIKSKVRILSLTKKLKQAKEGFEKPDVTSSTLNTEEKKVNQNEEDEDLQDM